MNKINEYLNELYIHEDFQKTFDGLTKYDKSYIKKLTSNVKKKDPIGSMKKLIKMIPTGVDSNKSLAKIENALALKVKEFPALKRRASIVIKNSVSGVSKDVADVAGTFLAFHSFFTKKGQENRTLDQNLKENLKYFVSEVRKFGDDYEEEDQGRWRPSDYSDLSVAWVVIVMSTSLAAGIGAGIYVALKLVAMAFAATLPWLLTAGFYSIIFFIMVALIIRVKAYV